MNSKNKALVIGGQGVTGSYIIHELLAQGNWDVTGVARRVPEASSGPAVPFVSVDISDEAACHAALKPRALPLCDRVVRAVAQVIEEAPLPVDLIDVRVVEVHDDNDRIARGCLGRYIGIVH
jgi:nucleoside-diphosphate-sugar epimerase